MRIIGEVRIDDMPKPSRGNRYRAPLRDMLREFLSSGMEACELSTEEYADEISAYISTREAIKRAGLIDELNAYLRSNHLYLVRRDKYAEKNS